MSKIRKVIKINSGYTSYVDLSADFYYYNEKENNERMALYTPIKAHRDAFSDIAKSINPKDRRAYFISGSYGTGKSHLCLMLGNYFLNESGKTELKKFFENYEKAQKDVKQKPGKSLEEVTAKTLSEKRKSGRYLVAICRFGTGSNYNFESTLLKAITEALKIDEANVDLNTHYAEAARRLADWKAREQSDRFYEDIKKMLEDKYSDWTYDNLFEQLKQNDEHAFKIFCDCFKNVTDTDFNFSKDNLIDILKDLLRDENFKSAYKGLVIIYDEFGYALDENKVDLGQFGEFAQFCTKSGLDSLPCVFIGTGHKSFFNHGKVGDKVHLNTLSARVNEIPLQTAGMENLISAIVHQRKGEKAWKKEVEEHSDIFSTFPKICKELGIFSWLQAPVLKKNIIEGIYPMHPFATYSLMEMAKELGSDNRSVFKFFAPEFEEETDVWRDVQDYSYPWFIEKNEIVKQDKLNLYTADMLIDYFLVDYFARGSDAMAGDIRERIKKSISDYQLTREKLNSYIQTNSEIELFKDELMEKILKVMLVIEIVSNEQISIINNTKNICFGLNAITKQEKKAVEARLKRLSEGGIIYLNEDKVYEFIHGDRKDIRRLVKEYQKDPQNHPKNILDKFLQLNPLSNDEKFLEAKNYNTTYNEDKRLKVIFISPTMLEQKFEYQGTNINFFEKIENDRKLVKNPKESYEGIAVYVFCENEQDIDKAKQMIKQNKSDRIVIGIPKKEKQVSDTILTLMALESIRSSKDAENFGYQENIQILEIKKKAQVYLENVKEFYFNNKNISWFKQEGSSIPVNENQRYEAAKYVMNSLFKNKQNLISHTEFNKIHIPIQGTKKRIFEEAAKLLIDLSKKIRFEWQLPENRGEKKYLQNIFVNNQIIKHLSTNGDFREFGIEKNKSKYKINFPAYFQMLNKMEGIEGKGAVSCKSFFREFFEDYGQGEIAVVLMTLLSRRFFGDSLRFKKQKNDLTDINIDSLQKISDILEGEHRNAVLIVEPVTEIEKKYFNDISEIFSEIVQEGKKYGIREAFNLITNWWEKQPIIAKSEDFYQSNFSKLIKVFSSSETTDPYLFIKNKIPEIYGVSNNEKLDEHYVKTIKKGLEKFKGIVENIEDKKKGELRKGISVLFAAKGDTEIDLKTKLNEWYHQLDSKQKDSFSYSDNKESIILISKIGELENIGKLIYETYPEKYGFGKVSEWQIDHQQKYIDKLKTAKDIVEANESKVSDVKIKYKNKTSQKGNTVYYRGDLEIGIEKESNDDVVYYTENGTDPSKKSENRKILKKGKKLNIEEGNKKYKFILADREGNYGKVKEISIIDETQDVIIKPSSELFNAITFRFPKNERESKISIKSYFQLLIKKNVFSTKSLKELVNEILDKM